MIGKRVTRIRDKFKLTDFNGHVAAKVHDLMPFGKKLETSASGMR